MPVVFVAADLPLEDLSASFVSFLLIRSTFVVLFLNSEFFSLSSIVECTRVDTFSKRQQNFETLLFLAYTRMTGFSDVV